MMLITISLIAGCGKSEEKPSKTDSKETTSSNLSNKGKKLVLLIPESKLEWTGKKVTGQHNGTVEITGGELFVDNGNLNGGSFDIDFRTIKNLDLQDAAMNTKLTNHLKSDDFFSAEKFPIGKFEMTSVSPLSDGSGNNYTIGGNLTIKGITNPVSFPAKVNVNGDAVTASADFKIDRTLWDVKFRSGKFFENLGDNLISDDIELKINIAAK
ncbi:MAG: YceI family protein [Ignavibacteria bacterium]|nr:YceI family protein [Ignavibacteria bacterium]